MPHTSCAVSSGAAPGTIRPTGDLGRPNEACVAHTRANAANKAVGGAAVDAVQRVSRWCSARCKHKCKIKFHPQQMG